MRSFCHSCRIPQLLLLTCIGLLLLLTGCRRSTGGEAGGGTKGSVGGGIARNEAEQAREAAVKMLTAMKERNADQVARLLYTKSHQRLIVIRMGKQCLDANAKQYRLDSMSTEDIDRAVKLVPDANQSLVIDMVRYGLIPGTSGKWDWGRLEFAAVKYAIPTGETILAPVVKEDGKWKMSDFSVFRIGLLKYRRVDDAIEAHDHTAVPQ